MEAMHHAFTVLYVVRLAYVLGTVATPPEPTQYFEGPPLDLDLGGMSISGRIFHVFHLHVVGRLSREPAVSASQY